MPCPWIVNEQTPERVEFKCTTCERVIGFVTPGNGEPNPVWDEATATWRPPENVLDWLGACP